jgi:diguanylate cyclase (GGDEF)-like protein
MDCELEAQLLNHLQSGIILLDQEARICAWNQWMTRHTAFTLEEVATYCLDQLFPEIAKTRLQDCIYQALQFKLSSMLTPGLNSALLPLYQNPKNPTHRMEQLIYITPVPRHQNMACLIQIHDMTATVRRERRLRAQSSNLIATSYRDALTGVGNRRRFDHDLMAFFTDARSKQHSLALLMIDIDDFKAYNDQLGHLQGDECLMQVATALQEGLRQRGDSISRYGGEEFSLLLPAADTDLAYSIAERLRLLIEAANIPHPASRTKPHITISIGVSALIPNPQQTMKTLIEQADQALYQAKAAGRNCCMVYTSAVASCPSAAPAPHDC